MLLQQGSPKLAALAAEAAWVPAGALAGAQGLSLPCLLSITLRTCGKGRANEANCEHVTKGPKSH